jgi:hypothetical protein
VDLTSEIFINLLCDIKNYLTNKKIGFLYISPFPNSELPERPVELGMIRTHVGSELSAL